MLPSVTTGSVVGSTVESPLPSVDPESVEPPSVLLLSPPELSVEEPSLPPLPMSMGIRSIGTNVLIDKTETLKNRRPSRPSIQIDAI